MRHLVGLPVVLAVIAASALANASPVETFEDSPFDASQPRWCERYHHAHWLGGAIRFTRSSALSAECTQGAEGSGWSCSEEGCTPCGCCSGSPCAKVGDANGNAVLMTARDDVGARREISVRFVLERPLRALSSHLGLYAALHPHCHTTVQALLVPDGRDRYHLNLAVLNEFIGGDRATYRDCLEHPFSEISPALAADIELCEDVPYRWTLAVEPLGEDLAVVSSVATADGSTLARGEFRFSVPGSRSWLGTPGGAARYGFGAQLGAFASRANQEPSVLLLDVRTATRGR